jgi:hypothetical protein
VRGRLFLATRLQISEQNQYYNGERAVPTACIMAINNTRKRGCQGTADQAPLIAPVGLAFLSCGRSSASKTLLYRWFHLHMERI